MYEDFRCPLITDYNLQGMKIPSEWQETFDRKMSDGEFSQKVNLLRVLSSHFTIGESIGMEKLEYIELCVESVYVKRWEGPSYREPPTAIVKAPEPGPQGLRPDFGLRI